VSEALCRYITEEKFGGCRLEGGWNSAWRDLR
jgi:hypothetical protein